MKVLQVANFVSPKSGGLRTAIDALRDGYEQMGWKVYRLTPFPDVSREHDVMGIRSVRVPTIGSYRVILGRRRVRQAIQTIQPDIVELSDKSTMSWISRWCKEQGIPCCVISHERMDLTVQHAGLVKVPLSMLSNHWKKQIARHSSRVVCASRFASEEFTSGDTPLQIIPLGVNIDSISTTLDRRQSGSKARIAMCSRLSEEKQPHIAIEAIRELSRHRNVQLVVMGDGPLRARLEELATGLDVVFHGHVSNREYLFRELGYADVVLNLGYVETFGLVTLEALAAGTPVIVANTGASPELIDAGCGRAVELTPEAVAQGIEEILDLDDVHLSEKCRARAEQFPWSRTVHEFAQLYEELVGESCSVS